MKFKEIKPGMVIHCPTEENAKELLKHLDKLGYAWNSGSNLLKDTMYNRYKGETCYYIESTGITYGSIGNFQQNEFDITEFPDLLEPELTAEEVLEWLILSILVYTFFSRMFDLMLPPAAKHSIAAA